MTEDQRKTTVSKLTVRLLKQFEKLEGYSRQEAMRTLVNMLDDLHLTALEFAFDMTPEPKAETGK